MLLWARFRALLSSAPGARKIRVRSSRRPAIQVLRWVVGLVVGVEILYVVAANSVLAFGWLPKLFSGTESVKAEVSSGWTIFPGAVHVRGLRITIQDYNVECTIELEQADVELRLRELPSRVFHATKVRGTGLTFRFRNHVAPESKDLPSVRALPPIAGLEDPPIYKAWAPEAPISDAAYNLWTVHVEDVDVRVKEMWVEQFRYLGRARAVGAFRLKPARTLWVGPASLELEPGRIVAAGREAFAGFAGKIGCTVHPFDVRVPQGLEVLRNISATVHLRGEMAQAQFVELFLPENARAHVEQHGAKLAVDVGMARGVLAESSRVSLEGDAVRVQVGELSADATGPWSIVGTGDGEKGGRAVATVSGTLLRRRDATHPITVRDAKAGLTSTSLDTTVSWGLRRWGFAVGELVAPDLRVLNDVRLGALRFRAGAGVLRGRVADSEGTLSGAGSAELRRAVVEVGQTEVRGSAALKATATAFDERRRTGAFDLNLNGTEIGMTNTSGDADCPWGGITKVEARAHLELLPHGRASGNIDGFLDGVRLRWGDFRLSGKADIRASVEPEPTRAGTESHVLGLVRAFQVRMKSGAGAPKRWGAQIPEIVADASLALDGARLTGPIEIKAKRVHASIGEVSMSSDIRARLRVQPMDMTARSSTVSGIVDIRQASLWRKDRRVEGWWAKIAISPTRVVADQNLDVDGTVSARFRDGLPGLLALSEADQIPGFLPQVLPLQGLVGTLSVRRRCQLTDIGISQVAGGPLVASGRIQGVPGETRGAVLVRLAGLEFVSAGVSLGQHGDGVSLFAGTTWLEKQVLGLQTRAAFVAAHRCEAPSPPTSCN